MLIINTLKVREIKDLRKKGFSIRQIAHLTGIPKTTVHRYICIQEEQDYKIIKLDDLQKKIFKHLDEGLTKKEIINLFNPKIKDKISKEVTFLSRFK